MMYGSHGVDPRIAMLPPHPHNDTFGLHPLKHEDSVSAHLSQVRGWMQTAPAAPYATIPTPTPQEIAK